jgi:hypothetical protein
MEQEAGAPGGGGAGPLRAGAYAQAPVPFGVVVSCTVAGPSGTCCVEAARAQRGRGGCGLCLCISH